MDISTEYLQYQIYLYNVSTAGSGQLEPPDMPEKLKPPQPQLQSSKWGSSSWPDLAVYNNLSTQCIYSWMLCRSASWTTASLTTGPACCSWRGTRARPGPASPSSSGTTSSHTDTTHSLLSGRYVLCCREQCFHCLEIADLATNVLRWVGWCAGIGEVVFTVSAATSCRGAARRGTPSSCATTPAPSPGGDQKIKIPRS